MIYIVTGPTHCGKSTYIKKESSDAAATVDILEFQQVYMEQKDDMTNINDMRAALYEFYCQIEETVYNGDFTTNDLWIEVCFSNSHRIGQLIHTILTADPNVEIKIIYLFHEDEFYENNLDVFTSSYAIEQQKIYDIYNSDIKNVEVIELNNFKIET